MFAGFRNFVGFSVQWLRSPGWSPRRLLVLIAFFAVFPLLEAMIWSGWLLDRVFFPQYRREAVISPVFIIGNPRSGTTFLHRLLSRDVERFTTMCMWEILFAPSILQRRLFHAMAAKTRCFTQALGARLAGIEENWYRKFGMHEISLTAPEEDDYLMLHIWSALSTGLSAGLIPQALPYTYFDSRIRPAERKRILSFYRKCIQRHLYDRRLRSRSEPGIYLAKNPALCPKLKSVKAEFPDAKFIYLVRDPLEMVPSYISMMQHSWRMVGVRNRREELREYIVAMARHWYRYPLEQMNAMKADHVIVRYEDLVLQPENTVRRIYRQLNFTIAPAFARTLQEECAKARHHRSRHRYDLAGVGLSRRDIHEQFYQTLKGFGFEKEKAF